MEAGRRVFQVNRHDICYLRYTIESYDGMAVVRTIDPHTAKIEVTVAPGCDALVDQLIENLRKSEEIPMVEVEF
jgi:hypothetical protein